MIDTATAQIILLLVIVVLAFLLIILGFQVFLILKEFRQSITKANKVLDDAGIITESISKPVSAISTITSLATGAKTGAQIINFLRKHKHTIQKAFSKDDDGE